MERRTLTSSLPSAYGWRAGRGKGRDFCCQTCMSAGEDVLGGVDVVVVDRSPGVQAHPLNPRLTTPFGPVRKPQQEQVWVENASSISSNHSPAQSHLYCSMVWNALQPASSVDFVIRVFARPDAFTLPMKIAPQFVDELGAEFV